MLANFLSKTKPINYVVLVFFFICCYTFTFFKVTETTVFTLGLVLPFVLFLSVFLGVFFVFNFIIIKNRLTKDNLFAFYFFILLLLLFLPNLLTIKTVSLLFLHLLFLRKIYSLKNLNHLLKKLFDAGFWLGITFLIEPLFIFYFSCLYLSAYLHQKITWHTLFSPIIGFITPLVLSFTYYFWIDKTEHFLMLLGFNRINNFLWYAKNINIWIFSVIILATLLAIILKSSKALSINNSFRKRWILLNLNLIVALLMGFTIPEKNTSEFVYFLIPVSIICANGLETIKKEIIKNSLVFIIFIGVIFNLIFLQ